MEETLPAWRDKFLCYKPLKKLLKRHFPNPTTPDSNLHQNHHDNTASTHGLDNQPTLVDLHEWFIRILNEELDKFNDFYVDKEEEFVIRFQVLAFGSFSVSFSISCLYAIYTHNTNIQSYVYVYMCLFILLSNRDLQVLRG